MKILKILILVVLLGLMASCSGSASEIQNENQTQTQAQVPPASGGSSEVYNMVGRWEMLGNIEGISYVYEFYPDHTGVTFASPHSYRELMFYVEENDIRIDYYQDGEIAHTEIMSISFDNDDQITLQAEGAVPITLIRSPLPDTPAYLRARVALLFSGQEYTIVSAEQEDEETWFATVQIAGEDDPRLVKVYKDESGVWIPVEVEP